MDETSEGIEGLRGRDASGLDGKEKRVAGAEAKPIDVSVKINFVLCRDTRIVPVRCYGQLNYYTQK
jgi:hypothetical protein